MDDLTKREAEFTAELSDLLVRLDRRVATLRRALEREGPSTTVTMMAGVVADEAVTLMRAAAKAEGYTDAVRRM